jgi:hypothetical protein
MTSKDQKAGRGAANKDHDEPISRALPIVVKVGPDASSREVHVPAPYRDYSRVPPERTAFQRNSKEPAQTFPMKLHEILTNPEFEDIISWLPHGRAWRIVRHKAFEERVIPLYFRHGRYSSFARQVNGWGFRRITHGTDYNSYYHEMFLRGLPHLCEKMKRLASKDEARVKNEEAPTPDFYALSRDHPLPDGGSTSHTDNQGTLAVGFPSSVGPILGEQQGYATGLPSSSQGAVSNPTAIRDLSQMSLEDLERQRAEIIRQMQIQISTGSSGASTANLGRQDFIGNVGMANLPTGAPAAPVSAHSAAPMPYTASSAAPGTAWNAPTSSMPVLPASGGNSQTALYQALISQLTSGAGNPPTPAPPPPPPPPPQQYGAASNQSILEALLGGGNNNGGLAQLLSGGGVTDPNVSSGGLAQLLSGGGGGGVDLNASSGGLAQLLNGGGGGGTDANSSALLLLQQQLQQNPQPQQAHQFQQSTVAPYHVNESRPTITADFQKPYEQPTIQQQGSSNDAAASIQRQIQLALAGQQGGNELALSGQQGGNEGLHTRNTSDFRGLYQQGSTAGHQRGGEDDLLAAIQRQLQQANSFPQQELQQQQLPQLHQQPQQLREQVSYQMIPPSQQLANDSDVMTNLQLQLQLAASQQNDPTPSMHQLQLLSQLSGQSNTGGGGGSGGGGNPNIAELAAMLGFSRQNDSSS